MTTNVDDDDDVFVVFLRLSYYNSSELIIVCSPWREHVAVRSLGGGGGEMNLSHLFTCTTLQKIIITSTHQHEAIDHRLVVS